MPNPEIHKTEVLTLQFIFIILQSQVSVENAIKELRRQWFHCFLAITVLTQMLMFVDEG